MTFANPSTDLEFSWSFNGTELNETFVKQITYQQSDRMKSQLILPINQANLFGHWTCSVSNTIGRSDPNCTIYVETPIGRFRFKTQKQKAHSSLSIVIEDMKE